MWIAVVRFEGQALASGAGTTAERAMLSAVERARRQFLSFALDP